MTHKSRSRKSRPKQDELGSVGRKPRVIIAGEFSAGKTRLITGFVGEEVLPSNVTATALPPVWLISGDRRLAVVDLDGKVRDIDSLDGIDVEETHYCVISHPAEILTRFEIIDTPGSSDPSIPAESWERMMGFADFALWCTNATQAWRQSEKSVWDELPEHLVGPAMLLVTHADRMADDHMAQRVLRRVQRETKKYFTHYEMASLIAPDDVARVSRKLDQIFGGDVRLAGSSNPVLDALIARWKSEPAPKVAHREPSDRIVPRRVSKLAKVTGPEAQSAGQITVLNTDMTKPSPEAGPSGIRAAWAEMSQNIDNSDCAAILACVDRFITLLERNRSLYLRDGNFSGVSSETKTNNQTPALMNGSQP